MSNPTAKPKRRYKRYSSEFKREALLRDRGDPDLTLSLHVLLVRARMKPLVLKLPKDGLNGFGLRRLLSPELRPA